MSVTVTRYQKSRFWAVWRGTELIAVTVYRKGAECVAAELNRKYENEENRRYPSLVQAA